MLGRLIVAAIRLYRRGLSPVLPPTCRFTPSCSEYAATAVERFGPARGGLLTLRRLLRCHPFGGRGFDPVPEAEGPETTPQRGPGAGTARPERGPGEARAGAPSTGH